MGYLCVPLLGWLAGWIAKRLRERLGIGALLVLLWLIVGAWIGYMLSVLGFFILFFLATDLQYLIWIPIGLPVHEICYITALFAAAVYALLVTMNLMSLHE